jgi:hypothetical protein
MLPSTRFSGILYNGHGEKTIRILDRGRISLCFLGLGGSFGRILRPIPIRMVKPRKNFLDNFRRLSYKNCKESELKKAQSRMEIGAQAVAIGMIMIIAIAIIITNAPPGA